jgi:hypothetical protein
MPWLMLLLCLSACTPTEAPEDFTDTGVGCIDDCLEPDNTEGQPS